MSVKPEENFEYYTDTVYWNDFPQVQRHINLLATGDETEDWMSLLSAFRPARALLSINCGNGWVERDIALKGLAESVIGLDIAEKLIKEAQRNADLSGLRATYRVMDANQASLKEFAFDYVLNHAALHHVAYLDRLIREIRQHMPEDGLFINYDYVGPHRNQYGLDAWSRMDELRSTMPEKFQGELNYPHLPTMLATDPTEAIHSELIIEIIERYFDLVVAKPLGGAIAYELLYKNEGLYAERDTDIGREWIGRILEEDDTYTDGELSKALFACLIARPKEMPDDAQLSVWTAEEEERELRALDSGGRYQPKTDLEEIHYGA